MGCQIEWDNTLVLGVNMKCLVGETIASVKTSDDEIEGAIQGGITLTFESGRSIQIQESVWDYGDASGIYIKELPPNSTIGMRMPKVVVRFHFEGNEKPALVLVGETPEEALAVALRERKIALKDLDGYSRIEVETITGS